jgi:beta-mannosidase
VARVDDVWWQGEVGDDLKTVGGKLLAIVAGGKKEGLARATVRFELSLDGNVAFQSGKVKVTKEGLATTDFKVENLGLWYPRGYGQQTLYVLKATLTSAEDPEPVAAKSRLTGFRRCELVQEPDEYGKSFYFRINNIDVFAGGSCWIPADSFLPRIGDGGYRKWMERMVEGNQIMTR